MKSFILILSLLFSFLSKAQNKNYRLTATVFDVITNKTLPQASILQKKTKQGTITDDKGFFTFIFPEENKNDTLTISYIGYKTEYLTIEEIKKNDYKISLEPDIFELNEIVLSPEPPIFYIRKMLENLPNNLPENDFSSIQYFKEELHENNKQIMQDEIIYNSYFSSSKDSTSIPSQILLHQSKKDVSSMVFMKKKLDKQEKKWRKKELKKEEINKDSLNNEPFVVLSGILGGINQMSYYFDVKNWKLWQDTTKLSTIDFKFSDTKYLIKDSVEYVQIEKKGRKGIKSVYIINTENYALHTLKTEGPVKIPLLIKPILFTMGIKIKSAYFYSTMQLKEINGKIFPNYVDQTLYAKTEQIKWFKENFKANFKAKQVGIAKSINTTKPIKIKTKHIYDNTKPVRKQVYNTLNINLNNYR